MLKQSRITATIPVTDIVRARDFYEKKLGLAVIKEPTEGGIVIQAGGDTSFYVYQREKSKADHTLAAFEVNDIEATVSWLNEQGVMMEQYDMDGGIKTNQNGIATVGRTKSAWFKDPDGNILGIVQRV